MKGTVFYKMTGSGNDFILLDGRHTRPEDWPAEAVRGICDRRLGVGADGLVILTPEGDGKVRMDFWNCDGSRADMCGNAALCSTRLAAFLGMAPPESMQLVTRAGTFPVRLEPEGERAALNLPDFRIPSRPPGVEPGPGFGSPTLATVGVPHLVLLTDDLERPDLMDRGRSLRSDPALGPAGANVNFLGTDSAGRWCIRTYERGVEAETLACGTGTVAAAVALAAAGKATLPMQIVTRSGRTLGITATLSGDVATDVWLAGEGRLVFTGVL